MAKVIGPLHSSEARGSVGSLTYNTWRGISIVKARAGPTIQYSDDQVAIRAKAAIATAAWQALTDAQRAAWENYAAGHADIDWTGNPKRITGYNWFIRINVRRQLLDEAISAATPTIEVVYTIRNLTLTGAATLMSITWTALPYVPIGDLFLEFYLVGPHSPGRHPNLPNADRRGHYAENRAAWLYAPAPPGIWTAFIRPIHLQGVVGTWQRVRGEVS